MIIFKFIIGYLSEPSDQLNVILQQMHGTVCCILVTNSYEFMIICMSNQMKSYVHFGVSACGCTRVAFSASALSATQGRRNSSPVIIIILKIEV